MKLLKELHRKKKIEARKKVAKRVALGTLVGGLLGSAAGIFLAPDSGKNTRQKIHNTAKDAKNNLERNIDEKKKQVEEVIQNKRTKIRTAVERIRKLGRNVQGDVVVTTEPIKEDTTKENTKL